MGLLDEFKKYFALKGETISKSEIFQIVLESTGVVPEKVPGFNLGAPIKVKVYFGGPGEYTLNGNSVLASDEINIFFWDKERWEILGVPVEPTKIKANRSFDINPLVEVLEGKFLNTSGNSVVLTNEAGAITVKIPYVTGDIMSLGGIGIVGDASKHMLYYVFANSDLSSATYLSIQRVPGTKPQPINENTTIPANSFLFVTIKRTSFLVDFDYSDFFIKNVARGIFYVKGDNKINEIENIAIPTFSDINGISKPLRFLSDNSVTVIKDKYLNTSFSDVVLQDEAGAITLKIPIEVNESIIIYNLKSKIGALASDFAIYYYYQNADGSKNTDLSRVSFYNKTTPFSMATGVVARNFIVITIFRSVFDVKYDYSNVVIKTSKGRDIFKFTDAAGAVNGHPIYNNVKLDRIDFDNSNSNLTSTAVVKKGSVNNQRNDHIQIEKLYNGDLFGCLQGFDYDASDYASSALYYTRSTDNGKTFVNTYKPFDNHYDDITAEANPNLCIIEDKIFIFYCVQRTSMGHAREVAYVKSIDNGISFSDPVYTGWMSTPTSAGTFKIGNKYIVIVYGNSSIDFVETIDKGETWTIRKNVTPHIPVVHEPFLYNLEGNNLMLGYRVPQASYCWGLKSEDGGATFGDPQPLFAAPESMSRAIKTKLLSNKLKPIWVSVHNFIPYKERTPHLFFDRRYMGLSVSEDGENWIFSGCFIYKFNGFNGVFEPFIYEDTNGDILISFSDINVNGSAYFSVVKKNDINKLLY